ncbi:MAG: insulinase family protein [Azonexus sp.]|jgi:zinc protease|nr:insulinase family protein [Betaproteobacteria bacterium]MBK8916678.1 insulinase family protein [Betaproteobacteria bacterium]MBP6036501.1 insulinase family protein [Azonexus sp.]MBP6907110.1 insulinase family protein [Azonexus sp.]
MKRLILAFTALAVLACAPLARAGVAIEHWVSPSGARVFYVASRGLPILDVQVDFAAGSMFDPQGKSGTAALTRALLDLGAGDLDENALADRLADVGAVLSGGADTDRASVALRTLAASDKRGPALEVMRAVLTAPRYDAAIFQREQARTVTSLKDALTRPDAIGGRAFWKALYPDHPYGRQSSPESVAALSRDEVLSFYRSHYTARNASVTLVGDLSRAEAETIAEALVAGLPAGAVAALPAPPSSPKGGRDDVAHPAAQAHIMVGLPTVERGNPDFFPLLVGNYTLGGGGFVSRLMKEVRDKRGYAYSVYSYFAPLKQAGPFQIGLQTKRSQARDALAVSLDVLKAFLAEGPTAQELEAAKANLTGSFPLRLDSNKKILDNVANIGFYGLPLDYLDRYQEKIAAVSAADVRRAFARHVRIESLVTVTVAAD